MSEARFRFCHLTDDQLLEVLKNWSLSHEGKSPRATIFHRSDMYPSPRLYAKRFGDWDSALIKAGLTLNPKKWKRTGYWT